MSSILALDVGESRIGVACANTIARLPSPYGTLVNSDTVISEIRDIIAAESVELLVVGLPRNLSGEDTDQTRYCREFAAHFKDVIPTVLQDEALTSRKAEKELQSRGKPYQKGDIDSLAATYILDDYLQSQRSL